MSKARQKIEMDMQVDMKVGVKIDKQIKIQIPGAPSSQTKVGRAKFCGS